ncbi:hypothetical protein HKX48_001224 [Thoreauomyces humboldtii]|nr:hypothetical protein HKX48_001224 [Thoreauomyces humboldtii]
MISIDSIMMKVQQQQQHPVKDSPQHLTKPVQAVRSSSPVSPFTVPLLELDIDTSPLLSSSPPSDADIVPPWREQSPVARTVSVRSTDSTRSVPRDPSAYFDRPKLLSAADFAKANRRLEAASSLRPRRAVSADRRGRSHTEPVNTAEHRFTTLHPPASRQSRSRSLSPAPTRSNGAVLERIPSTARPPLLSQPPPQKFVPATGHHTRTSSLRNYHEYYRNAQVCESPDEETIEASSGKDFIKSARSFLSFSRNRGQPYQTTRASTYPPTVPNPIVSIPATGSPSLSQRHTNGQDPRGGRSVEIPPSTVPTTSVPAPRIITVASISDALAALPKESTQFLESARYMATSRHGAFDSNSSTPPVPVMFPITRTESSESIMSVQSVQWASVDYNLSHDDWKNDKLAVMNPTTQSSSSSSSAASAGPSPRSERRIVDRLAVVQEVSQSSSSSLGPSDALPQLMICPPTPAVDAVADPLAAYGASINIADNSVEPVVTVVPSPPSRAEAKAGTTEIAPAVPMSISSASNVKTEQPHGMAMAPSAEFHLPSPPRDQPPVVVDASIIATLPTRPPTPPSKDSSPPPSPPRKESKIPLTPPPPRPPRNASLPEPPSASTLQEYSEWETRHRRDVETTRLERRISFSPKLVNQTSRTTLVGSSSSSVCSGSGGRGHGGSPSPSPPLCVNTATIKPFARTSTTTTLASSSSSSGGGGGGLVVSPRPSQSKLAARFMSVIRRRKSLPTRYQHHRNNLANANGTAGTSSLHLTNRARSSLNLHRGGGGGGPNGVSLPLPDYLMQYAEHGHPAANVDFDPIKMASDKYTVD